MENLRAVGLRNKMAAMHEVSTGLAVQNHACRRSVTCWRSHGSCVGHTGAAAQAATAAATAEGEEAGARQVTWLLGVCADGCSNSTDAQEGGLTGPELLNVACAD